MIRDLTLLTFDPADLGDLGELIDKDVISPDKALKLIEQVEQGRIPLSQALALIQALLQEKQS